MKTKNYLKSQIMLISNTNINGITGMVNTTNNSTTASGYISVGQAHLTTINFNLSSSISIDAVVRGGAGYHCIFIGTDDTEATENDYTLGAPIAYSTSTVEIVGRTFQKTDDVLNYVTSITLFNHGEDINVKEVGLVAWWLGSSTSSSWGPPYLLDRTNVDFVFKSNSSITISYVFRCKQ